MKLPKLLIPLCLFIAFNFQVDAQYGGCLSKEDLQSKFITTKTLVLLTGDETFDANIKKGMKEYWTLTEYEFVDSERMMEIGYSTNYSVMQPYQLIRTEQSVTQVYYYWGIVLPSEKSEKEGMIGEKNVVASVLLDGFGRERDVTTGAYRAKHMVRFLSNFLTMKLADEIDCACAANGSFMRKHFNASSEKVKTKTLLVDEYYVKKGIKEAFVKYYPGKVEFVSTDEIEEAINNKEEGYCYLLPVFTFHKYIYIVDAESGDINYELYSTYGMALNPKDIKAIGGEVFEQ